MHAFSCLAFKLKGITINISIKERKNLITSCKSIPVLPIPQIGGAT